MVPFHLRYLHPQAVIGHGCQNGIHLRLIHLQPYGNWNVPADFVAHQITRAVKAIQRSHIAWSGRCACSARGTSHRHHSFATRRAACTGIGTRCYFFSLFFGKSRARFKIGGFEIANILACNAQLNGHHTPKWAVHITECLGSQKFLIEVEGTDVHRAKFTETARLSIGQGVAIETQHHLGIGTLGNQELGLPVQGLIIKSLRPALTMNIADGAFLGKPASCLGNQRQLPEGIHQHHGAGIFLAGRFTSHHGHFAKGFPEGMHQLAAHGKIFLQNPEFLWIGRNGECREFAKNAADTRRYARRGSSTNRNSTGFHGPAFTATRLAGTCHYPATSLAATRATKGDWGWALQQKIPVGIPVLIFNFIFRGRCLGDGPVELILVVTVAVGGQLGAGWLFIGVFKLLDTQREVIDRFLWFPRLFPDDILFTREFVFTLLPRRQELRVFEVADGLHFLLAVNIFLPLLCGRVTDHQEGNSDNLDQGCNTQKDPE